MKREFIPYKEALQLKALGFDEPCFSFYMGGFEELGRIKYVNPINVAETNVLAPTFSQAFRWFRENYSWTIEIKQVTKSNWSYTLNNFPKERTYYGQLYDTYEEAELACLDKLLEIVESKS